MILDYLCRIPCFPDPSDVEGSVLTIEGSYTTHVVSVT